MSLGPVCTRIDLIGSHINNLFVDQRLKSDLPPFTNKGPSFTSLGSSVIGTVNLHRCSGFLVDDLPVAWPVFLRSALKHSFSYLSASIHIAAGQ